MNHIAEYDAVDPLQVLHINLLCLNLSLTPELAALMRRMDPRPFPFFALYALNGSTATGQVGVFRLPVVSTTGAADVGGVWAVSTHPAWRGQGVASRLLDEAHERMRAAGLRFSTLGTARFGVAHGLYEKLGYRDLYSPAMALARSDDLRVQPGLRVEPAGPGRLALADRLFEQLSRGWLGFARRHTPFFSFLHARSYLSAQELWLIWQESEAVGYAAAAAGNGVLRVHNLLLAPRVDPVAAVAALALAATARYVHVRLDHPDHAAAFARAGLRVASPSWATFMVKPLAADATLEEFRRDYGLDDGRFLISYLDVT
ncbi:MAG TPA: GNAT family N-acetyltransferase [Anaerolineae bacterium]|nr:GNAT family N-acetyltransferase [Anaerolineae bacterium]HNU02770.1 GNAT family N-acetyltransferase [Anaerolineae bacterium]